MSLFIYSLIPLVNSPSKDTPSVAKSVRIGIATLRNDDETKLKKNSELTLN